MHSYFTCLGNCGIFYHFQISFSQQQFQHLHELPLAVHDIRDVKFHAFVASGDVGDNGGGVHEVVARLVQLGTPYEEEHLFQIDKNVGTLRIVLAWQQRLSWQDITRHFSLK